MSKYVWALVAGNMDCDEDENETNPAGFWLGNCETNQTFILPGDFETVRALINAVVPATQAGYPGGAAGTQVACSGYCAPPGEACAAPCARSPGHGGLHSCKPDAAAGTGTLAPGEVKARPPCVLEGCRRLNRVSHIAHSDGIMPDGFDNERQCYMCFGTKHEGVEPGAPCQGAAASPSIREPGLRPKGEPCECVHAPEQHGSRGCGVVRAFGESCPCLWMGKRSKPGPRPDHYIISLKWTSGNHTTTFEREGRRGYTTRINQAGLWTKEDAEKATEGSRGDSLAVDRADVDEFAVRVLPAERAFELARKREPAGDPPTSEPVTVPFGAGTLTVDHLAETCAHGIPTATCTEHAKPCAACNGERFVSNVSSKGQRQRAPCTNCNLAAYGTPPLFPWPPTSEGSK